MTSQISKTWRVLPCFGLCALLLLLVAACQPATSAEVAGAAAAPVETATVTPEPPTAPPTASPMPTATTPLASPTPTTSPTASPMPTATTPPASPTPMATQPPRFAAKAAVNVRGGPGTNYEILGQLAAGARYALLGISPGHDWLQFSYDGQVGWVAADLVQVDGVIEGLPVPANIPAPPPERLVAPAIRLDTRVIPVGWHVVQTANGPAAEWDVASYAAGWLTNSVRPGQVGNMVLSGHHNIEGEVFRYVVDLKKGDLVQVYAGGKEYRYTVVDKFILPDKYVSAKQRQENGTWIGQYPDERLTLVTCWPYTNNTHRVIVIARPEGNGGSGAQ